VLRELESGLVALRGRCALEMDATPVSTNAGVEVLVTELEVETELLTVESD
jgi:hypothetical protein